MKGKKNNEQKTTKNVKRSNSVQKKIQTKKATVEMPPISSNVNEQIDFASNIFKLYSGVDKK